MAVKARRWVEKVLHVFVDAFHLPLEPDKTLIVTISVREFFHEFGWRAPELASGSLHCIIQSTGAVETPNSSKDTLLHPAEYILVMLKDQTGTRPVETEAFTTFYSLFSLCVFH